jgi:hypothetical protein
LRRQECREHETRWRQQLPRARNLRRYPPAATPVGSCGAPPLPEATRSRADGIGREPREGPATISSTRPTSSGRRPGCTRGSARGSSGS